MKKELNKILKGLSPKSTSLELGIALEKIKEVFKKYDFSEGSKLKHKITKEILTYRDKIHFIKTKDLLFLMSNSYVIWSFNMGWNFNFLKPILAKYGKKYYNKKEVFKEFFEKRGIKKGSSLFDCEGRYLGSFLDFEITNQKNIKITTLSLTILDYDNIVTFKENKPKEETLCEKYRNSVNEYIKQFSEQFEERFLGWKGEKFGEIACFSSGFSFEFADIRYFVDNKIKSDTHLVYFHGFNKNFPKAKCTLKEYTEKSDKEILYSRIK